MNLLPYKNEILELMDLMNVLYKIRMHLPAMIHLNSYVRLNNGCHNCNNWFDIESIYTDSELFNIREETTIYTLDDLSDGYIDANRCKVIIRPDEIYFMCPDAVLFDKALYVENYQVRTQVPNYIDIPMQSVEEQLFQLSTLYDKEFCDNLELYYALNSKINLYTFVKIPKAFTEYDIHHELIDSLKAYINNEKIQKLLETSQNNS